VVVFHSHNHPALWGLRGMSHLTEYYTFPKSASCGSLPLP
jgi:hypothetical protein